MPATLVSSASPFADVPSLRATLEHQLALLGPVLDHLRHAALERSPLLADDWRGPTAEAAAGFVSELHAKIGAAESAVDDALRVLRIRIASLP